MVAAAAINIHPSITVSLLESALCGWKCVWTVHNEFGMCVLVVELNIMSANGDLNCYV